MRHRSSLTHENRVLLLALLAGLPGVAVAMYLLVAGDYSTKLVMTLALPVIGAWFGFAFAARERVVRPLQTVANMVAALLEGDYSIRFRGGRTNDALGLAMLELNALGGTLRENRMGALEAAGLLRKVIEEIDIAIFTFDDKSRLRLVNRAGERLLGHPAEQLLARDADSLGLRICIEGDTPRMLETSFPGGMGRYEVRRTSFRQGGRPHQLVVLADLSRTLRVEEQQAWKRLIRVLSHEINNSLAPIKSIAGSLQSLLQRPAPPPDMNQDLEQGLNVIATRSEALGRFMAAYAQLARLPAPKPAAVIVEDWIDRVASLETRRPIEIASGPAITLHADGDQLDQLLINLVRNAVDAALETGGGVQIGWARREDAVEVWVDDEGPGLDETGNLFVPFFTTKPSGSGIGLALSRQIAEAHDGTLTLQNHPEHLGCRALLRLPLNADNGREP